MPDSIDLRPLKRCSNDGCCERTRSKYCFECQANQPTIEKQKYQRYDSKDRDPDSYRFYHSKAWDILRTAQIKRFPACQAPTESGIPCLSTDRVSVDHITPRKLGGLDSPANLQTLCYSHHSTKTANELRGHFGRTPVSIICGPSGSGKTTYVRKRLTPGCIVWDMDAVTAALTGSPIHYQSDAVLSTVLSVRAHLQSTLIHTHGITHIYWIESAPTILRRQTLRDELKGDVYVLDPGIDACKQRLLNDQDRDCTYDWCSLVDDWYKKYYACSLDIVIS